jgi:predicted Zn-dependent protease
MVTIADHWIQRRPPPIRTGADRPSHLVAWQDLVGEQAQGDDMTAVEALAYASAGQREESERLMARASGEALRMPSIYALLARHEDETHQLANVARAYRTLLHLDPDAQGPLMSYAQLMLDRGPEGADEATHALGRLLALDADDPGALETKGIFLFRSGRIDEARPLFAHAATAGPATAASHVALAVLARRDGRDAIAELESARRIEPRDGWILDQLRDAYTKAGDSLHLDAIERARKYFMKSGQEGTAATGWLPPEWR